LDWVPDYSSLKEQLRADEGYALTHVGRLRRADGAFFTSRRAAVFVESLCRFFGFVRGAWSGPVLLSGRDHADRTVWEEWSARLSSPNEYHESFFHPTTLI
jgi:hypothetical protein